jgi:hypothetical protein
MLIGIPQLVKTISFGCMDDVKAARELVLPKVLAAGRVR